MKKVLLVVRGVFEAFGVLALVLILATAVRAQFNGAQAGRSLNIPSVFYLAFGDVTTSDVYLQKNGANNLGLTGHLGGPGSTANSTNTPAGNFAWGTVTLAANTATVTFAQPFAVAPACVATDQTTAQLVKAAPTTTTVVITDTLGATDVVAYACFGNPN